MTATFTLFDEFPNNVGKKLIDLSADTFKAVLSNVAPVQDTDDEVADITQIAATGGYAAVTLTGVAWAETGAGTGIWRFTCSLITFTASGADFATARYMVIYDDTSTNDKLVGYIDHGAGFVVADGASYKVTPHASNGLFLLTTSP